METENRIERTIGLVILAVLTVGCALMLRPFFTAVCFALILVIATWPAFDRLQRLLGGRRALAALLMVTLATLVACIAAATFCAGVRVATGRGSALVMRTVTLPNRAAGPTTGAARALSRIDEPPRASA